MFETNKYETEEEILQNYELRVGIRVLKHDFPFVLGLHSVEQTSEYKSFIFINLEIDITMISHDLNMKLPGYVKYLISSNKDYTFTSLRYLFGTESPEEVQDKMKKTEDEMQKALDYVAQSPTIPIEMKMGKKISILSFISEYDKVKYPELLKWQARYDYDEPDITKRATLE